MPPSDARETGANALIPRVAGDRRASETTQCASPSAASPLGIGRAIRTVRSRAVPHSPKENGGASAGGSQAAMRVSAHCACSCGSKPRARVSAVCVDPVVETNGQRDESFGSIPRRAAGADGKYRPALAAARYRTHRAKRHAPLRGARKETGEFWRIREGSRAGSAVAISRRVTVRTVNLLTFASMAMFVEMVCTDRDRSRRARAPSANRRSRA